MPGQQAKVESSLQTLQVFVAGFIFQSANSCLLPPEFFDSAGPVVGFFPRVFLYERSLHSYVPQRGILYNINKLHFYMNYLYFIF